jgi:hypothetical protein
MAKITVTITETVEVTDLKTLRVWLNQELEQYAVTKRDGGTAKATIGSKALDLIKEAGFEIKCPIQTRYPGSGF